MVAGFDAAERGVWELMLAGDRSTAAWAAAALGVADQSRADQEREVKRVKDRIKTRLRRAKGAGA